MSARATPASLAQEAAEAIRSLNHATIFGAGYVWPSDVDAVVGGLCVLVSRLPQALGQASRWLIEVEAVGAVGHDQDGDVEQEVAAAVAGIGEACRHAEQFAAALGEVREITAHLTGATRSRREARP